MLICFFLFQVVHQGSFYVLNRSIIYLLLHRRRTESSKVTPSRQTIWQNLCQAKWWSDLVPRWAVHIYTHRAVSAPPNSEQSHLSLIYMCVCARACIMVPKLCRTGNMLRSNHPLSPAVNESLDPSHTHTHTHLSHSRGRCLTDNYRDTQASS